MEGEDGEDVGGRGGETEVMVVGKRKRRMRRSNGGGDDGFMARWHKQNREKLRKEREMDKKRERERETSMEAKLRGLEECEREIDSTKIGMGRTDECVK